MLLYMTISVPEREFSLHLYCFLPLYKQTTSRVTRLTGSSAWVTTRQTARAMSKQMKVHVAELTGNNRCVSESVEKSFQLSVRSSVTNSEAEAQYICEYRTIIFLYWWAEFLITCGLSLFFFQMKFLESGSMSEKNFQSLTKRNLLFELNI